jgi:hypothetical protein
VFSLRSVSREDVTKELLSQGFSCKELSGRGAEDELIEAKPPVVK